MNYAPFWYHQQGYWSQRAIPVLLTSGQYDTMTPHSTAEALAAAARMNILTPAMNAPEAHSLRGLAPVTNPASNNATGFDGSPVTAALSQWPEGDHFVIFDIPEAADMYRDFLSEAIAGSPSIDNNL